MSLEVKMASASPLKEIDEKFCLCSICLDQLKEPKLLACLHRFCKDCLNTLIQASNDTFRCPECREEIQIPHHGVDGFKTDFYMKNLVEYVQIQQSLQSDEMRECYGCSKQLRVTSYCFKCNDFLCKDCHNFHVTNKFLKEHQKHTLSLEDIESKNMTIEKLASMRDAPRCQSHPEKVSELYCETCNNLSVCMACMLGEHKGHDLHEVKTLAKSKRKLLAEKLATLEKLEKSSKLTTPGQAKEKLISNITSEKEKLCKMYKDEAQKTRDQVQEREKRQVQMKHEKHNNEKLIFESLQREMEIEIQGVREKYEKLFKEKRTEFCKAIEGRERSVEKELANLNEELKLFDKDVKELLRSLEMQLNKNLKDIEAISDYFHNTKKRFLNLQVLASSIIASENDWTVVQCFPDIYTAADNLLKDLKKEFPELEKLIDVTINYKQSSFGKPSICSFGKPSICKISEEVANKITLNNTYRYVNGVAKSGDGNIVISGCSSHGKAFIIVIDVNGTIIKQKNLIVGIQAPWHVCDFLSQNKVATVCSPDFVGVYNLFNGSYITRNIMEVSNSWPKGRVVGCVATDPVNLHILVGGENSRDVYVFDDELNYLHILSLPKIMKWPRDITVSDGHLLVCDYDGKKCYLTTMDELDSKVVGEVTKQNLRGNWRPLSVCTDKNGLVYMLWRHEESKQCYLIQYTQDGSHVLSARNVDDNAYVVATTGTSHDEKLLVATNATQTVYMYLITY